MAYGKDLLNGTKMQIKIIQDGADWMVEFSVGMQSFRLDYRSEDKKEAEWMAMMLMKALLKVKEFLP